MILSKNCKSKYLRRAISKITRLIDRELYCDVHFKKDASYFFPVENYYDNNGIYGDILVKSRRANWDTILEMVPLIGEAHTHYEMLTEGIETPEKAPLMEYFDHWRKGIYWLKMHDFDIDEVACYKEMIRKTSW